MSDIQAPPKTKTPQTLSLPGDFNRAWTILPINLTYQGALPESIASLGTYH